MKILETKSSRVILFKHNQIPFHKFSHPNFLGAFNKEFKFAQINPYAQDPSTNELAGISLNNGIFKAKDGKELPILTLNVEQRKMNI
jgi:hypothetical protein